MGESPFIFWMMKVLCTSSIIYIAQDHHLRMELTELATIDLPFSHCFTCSVVTPAFLTACTIRSYSVLGEIQLKYTLKSNYSFLHWKFWLPFWDAGTGVEPSVLEIDLTHQEGAIAVNNLLIFETEKMTEVAAHTIIDTVDLSSKAKSAPVILSWHPETCGLFA